MPLTYALTFLLGLAGTAHTACSNFLIDDFSRPLTSGVNNLQSWTSDDNSMAKISLGGGVLSFTPKSDTSSYYYETLGCFNASTQGYKSISLNIKGPKDASMMLEIQTKRACTDENYQSQWVQITGMTGSTQTIGITLSSFPNANLDVITGFVWSTFSQFAGYEISNLRFNCASPTESVTSIIPASTRSSVVSQSLSSTSRPTNVQTSSSTRISNPSLSTFSTRSTPSPSSPSSRTSTSSTPASKTSASSSRGTLSSQVSSRTSATATSSSRSSSQSSSRVSSSPIPISSRSSTVAQSSSPAPSSCSNLLIDDWSSQSRLTFLFYNSMMQPSSDDGTMKEIIVSDNNRVTLKPNGPDSYFYSKTACTNAVTKGYGGISMRINAPVGTTFGVQLASSTNCGEDTTFGYQTTGELGWKFDGTEKLYSLPFSKFSTVDKAKVSSILFSSLSKDVTLGPMAFYCGGNPSEYVVNTQPSATAPVLTVPAPTGTSAPLVVDRFTKSDANALGHWHGGDTTSALKWGSNRVTITPPDADFAFYTQLSDTCGDYAKYDGSYLHITFTGSNKFSIAMQQHNQQCDDSIAPFPETWDSLEAARYTTGNDIYIPMSHFKIERKRVVGLAFKGWYTREATTLTKVEIVASVPAGVRIPEKLPSGNLVFACKRPNSIAFAIDDGDPKYAQEVMDIIRSENIKVTFFTVGAPLRDSTTNLSNIYQGMMKEGHQMAYHSYTHPRMEGLPNDRAIFWEYDEDIKAVEDMFNLRTKYFRPPFGNEGARMRQQLVQATGSQDAYIVNWNIDVEDWLYAQSDTPEKQLESFKRDLDKGGSLVVMHYLYPSTVSYLRQFIRMAKATGKQLMRVDQCMMDPNAPPV